MEWTGGVLNRIDALDRFVESTGCSDIGHDDKLKLARIDERFEEFKEMGALGFAPDRATDCVTFLKEILDQPDGDEAIRTGDKDFGCFCCNCGHGDDKGLSG